MTPLDITVNLAATPWDDVDINATEPLRLERLGFAPDYTASGAPAVVFLLTDPEGRKLIAVTTYRLFRGAARVFAATPSAILLAEEDGLDA